MKTQIGGDRLPQVQARQAHDDTGTDGHDGADDVELVHGRRSCITLDDRGAHFVSGASISSAVRVGIALVAARTGLLVGAMLRRQDRVRICTRGALVGDVLLLD